ncbi:MAG: TolC family protein [Pseudomonadota bacterium]
MDPLVTRVFCACCCALALLAAPALSASAPLTLRQAIQAALAGNPDLAGFAFELRAQEARTVAAGLRPAPTLSVGIENAPGNGEHRRFDAAESTFALSQVVELGGKRAARVGAAQAGRELITVAEQAAQLDVLAEVTRRFIHVAGDQEQLALTRQATALARETVAAVSLRVQAAKAPQAELRRARITLARAEVAQEHAEHELRSSRRKLAALWGDDRARFGSVTADLYALPRPVPFEDLLARLDRNPDFVRFASEARLRDAELRLAQARRRADITVSGGLRHLEATGDQALVLGFSLPLGAGRQAAPAIAEADALRGLTGARHEAARVRARAQLFELYQELRHAITETELLRRTVLPEMQGALEDTRYAYERGRYGYLEWVEAQRDFLTIRRSLIEAAVNAQVFQAEIERLTGEAVATQSLQEHP